MLYDSLFVLLFFFFFFNDTPTTEIYTLSLHDALPILRACTRRRSADARRRAGANQELRGDEPMSAPAPTTRCLPPLTARRSCRTSTTGEGGAICCSAPIGAGRACSRLTSRRRSIRPGTK